MTDTTNRQPVSLFAIVTKHRRALIRLENELHSWAEARCNGVSTFWSPTLKQYLEVYSEEQEEQYQSAMLKRVQKYLPVPVFFNGDPRGHALKVAPEHAGDLPQDWGRYGIVAPSNDLFNEHTEQLARIEARRLERENAA
jgi:hypothetical protein